MSETLAQAAQLMQSRRFGEAEALYRQAAAQAGAGAEVHFGLALALEAQRRPEEAEAAYRQALDLKPDFAEAACNLGSMLLRRERSEEALPLLQGAVEAKPGFAPAQANLGLVLLSLGRAAEAEAAFRSLLEQQPGNPMALNELGRALLQQTKLEEAIAVFRDGHDRQPKEPRFLSNLAAALELANDLEGAQQALDKALALAPKAPPLLFAQAKLARRRGETGAARQALDSMLAQELPQAERAEALLDFGQTLEEEGASAQAFAAFAEANALRRESPAARRHDGAAFIARVAAIGQAFSAEAVTELAAKAPKDTPDDVSKESAPAPVFFVGFPRSGTSLMEQALNAHPVLVTTGERSPLAPLISTLSKTGAYPAGLSHLTAEDIAKARQAFWLGAEQLVGPLEGRVLVDKTALNIVHLGVVNALFPDARVIVALRDPRDVCLSCFMQRFQLSEATVNFLDLAQTARCYAAVMGLWQQYRQVLTLPMQSYRYEDLVGDFEGTLRGLLDFLEVGWDDRVLRYRENAAASRVTTPSYHQVAKPLYGGAQNRWQRYREALTPVLPMLAPFAEAYGYEA